MSDSHRGALLDSALEALIKAVFVPNRDDRLLAIDGPLGTFSNRFRIAAREEEAKYEQLRQAIDDATKAYAAQEKIGYEDALRRAEALANAMEADNLISPDDSDNRATESASDTRSS